jgi:hypothetical protein
MAAVEAEGAAARSVDARSSPRYGDEGLVVLLTRRAVPAQVCGLRGGVTRARMG